MLEPPMKSERGKRPQEIDQKMKRNVATKETVVDEDEDEEDEEEDEDEDEDEALKVARREVQSPDHPGEAWHMTRLQIEKYRRLLAIYKVTYPHYYTNDGGTRNLFHMQSPQGYQDPGQIIIEPFLETGGGVMPVMQG